MRPCRSISYSSANTRIEGGNGKHTFPFPLPLQAHFSSISLCSNHGRIAGFQLQRQSLTDPSLLGSQQRKKGREIIPLPYRRFSSLPSSQVSPRPLIARSSMWTLSSPFLSVANPRIVAPLLCSETVFSTVGGSSAGARSAPGIPSSSAARIAPLALVSHAG